MTKCSVSIVFYNTKQAVAEKTISSLCTCSMIDKIFIVDNGGELNYENIKQICSDSFIELSLDFTENKGLSVAQNQIINKKDLSEFHLILNPDIFIDDESMSNLLDYFQEHPEVSALGPQIVLPSGEVYPSAKMNPDPFTQIIRRFSPDGKTNSNYELRNYKFSNPLKVPMISGCFILTKSKYLKSIGGFDPRFFLYFEDIDLLMRLKDYGEIHYNPDCSVTKITTT